MCENDFEVRLEFLVTFVEIFGWNGFGPSSRGDWAAEEVGGRASDSKLRSYTDFDEVGIVFVATCGFV